MVQSIMDGITAAIKTKYDDSCFSISCQNTADVQKAVSRHRRVNIFLVKYFPTSTEGEAECFEVMESLYDLLSIISVGTSKLRGTELGGKIVDGVLQFQVTYSFFLLAPLAENDMEQLEIESIGKE